MKKLISIIALLGTTSCGGYIPFPCHFQLADTFTSNQKTAILDALDQWNDLSINHSSGKVFIYDGDYHSTDVFADLHNHSMQIFPITTKDPMYTWALKQYHSTSINGFARVYGEENDIVLVMDNATNEQFHYGENESLTLRKIVLHEAGHTLGLKHTDVLGELMYGKACSFDLRPAEITPQAEESFCLFHGCQYKTNEIEVE